MSARKRARKSTRFMGFTIPHLSPTERYQEHVRAMFLAISEHDWHCVADCAMDIRELVAAHPELRRFEARLWSKS